MEKRDFLIIISLFFLAYLIRIAGMPNVGIYPDEGLYLNDINKILANSFVPIPELFAYLPPFFQYVAAVVTVFFQQDLTTIRMISVIFGSLTVPFLYLLGKEMYDRKTGLLAALSLCLSTYHGLYSRIAMLEAFTLFFIIAFLYFFWMSQRSEHEQKNMTYAKIAGAFLGLAIDAKYISLFLVIMVPLYVLWMKKFNFRALIDKRLILIFLYAFIFFLPLLLSLIYTNDYFEWISYYTVSRFGKETAAGSRLSQFSIGDLLVKGIDTIMNIFTWGGENLIPGWETIFELSAILLIFISILFYLPRLIKKEKEASFIMISLFPLYIFLLGSAAYKHYHLYSLPFYFLMFSDLTVKSFIYLKRENNYKNIYRILIIFFMAIILLSSFVTSVTSSYWDKGEYSPVKVAADYIKNDIVKNGYRKDIVIGVNFRPDIFYYYGYPEDFNISTITILKKTGKFESKLGKLDLDKIRIMKLDYLVIIDHNTNRFFLEGQTEKDIIKEYSLIFHLKKYFLDVNILKRNELELPELPLPVNSINGTISREIFERSLPRMMKIGVAYTVLVPIQNTGDSRTQFNVKVVTKGTDNFRIYTYNNSRDIYIEGGAVQTLKFKIVAVREQVGKLPITVELLAKYGTENERLKQPCDYLCLKVDSVTGYIYSITD